MAQVIQIKRRTAGAGAPASLAPGELAYNTTGNTLAIGDSVGAVQLLVGPTRQVEVTGNQTISGNKTMPVTGLKLTGGAAGNVVQTDGAGNLSFVAAPPPTPASAAEMAAATRNDVFDTPLASLGITGVPVAQLTTVAKVLVPAINELKAAVDSLGSGGQTFSGSFRASDGVILWTAASGGTGNALPPADAGNNGWYLVCEAAGTTPPTGSPAGDYNSGDWLLSDGLAWTHLAFGGTTAVTASQVSVSPTVAGATEVQSALTAIDAKNTSQDAEIVNKADYTYVNSTNATQDAAIALKADKTYVDTQDALKANTADVSAALALKADITYVDSANATQDAAIALKPDKAYVDSQDGLRVLKAGDTMQGALGVPLSPSDPAHATSKQYVDNLVAGVAGGASVVVTGPELTGTGLAADPIIFHGITVGTEFTGNGLSATPLVLAVVDGGTY